MCSAFLASCRFPTLKNAIFGPSFAVRVAVTNDAIEQILRQAAFVASNDAIHVSAVVAVVFGFLVTRSFSTFFTHKKRLSAFAFLFLFYLSGIHVTLTRVA